MDHIAACGVIHLDVDIQALQCTEVVRIVVVIQELFTVEIVAHHSLLRPPEKPYDAMEGRHQSVDIGLVVVDVEAHTGTRRDAEAIVERLRAVVSRTHTDTVLIEECRNVDGGERPPRRRRALRHARSAQARSPGAWESPGGAA